MLRRHMTNSAAEFCCWKVLEELLSLSHFSFPRIRRWKLSAGRLVHSKPSLTEAEKQSFTLSSDLLKPSDIKMKTTEPAPEELKAQCGRTG